MPAAVEASGLSVSFDGFEALIGVSFSLQAGDFAALMGPVGSGKSTLLQCLNGVIPKLVPATFAGSLRIFGRDAAKHSVQQLSADVAMVFQDPDDQIFSASVEEEVGFALSNRGVGAAETKSRTESALQAVGLKGFNSRDPQTLSEGQKQKVCIASALASDARLIALDEPTSALDWRSSLELMTLLNRLAKDGKTIILASHDSDILAASCSRFLVIDGGRLVLDGGREVFKSPLYADAGLKPVK